MYYLRSLFAPLLTIYLNFGLNFSIGHDVLGGFLFCNIDIYETDEDISS